MTDVNFIGVRCVLLEKNSPFIIVRVRNKANTNYWYKPNEIYKVIINHEYDDLYLVKEKNMIAGFGIRKSDCDII